MGLRRFYAYARRRWQSCLFMIALFGFVSFCSLLYLASVLLLERKNDIFLLSEMSSRMEDEIKSLRDVEVTVFQGDDVFNRPYKLPISTTTKRRKGHPRKDLTIFNTTKTLSIYYRDEKRKPKYFYLLGHYEQLGKTTINFMQAALLSDVLGRKLVVPYVRNSRFCGMPGGWTGQLRKTSRLFLPIENYFDISSLVNVFKANDFSKLATFEEFRNDCKKSRNNVVIYFLYNNAYHEAKRYMELKKNELAKISSQIQENGYTDCSFVADRIKLSKRINNIKLHKGICIDPEIVRSEVTFYKLIEPFQCSIIHLWRGFGIDRTRFNLSLPFPFDHHLSQLKFSYLIEREVSNYINDNFLDKPFIGIHIRSERQLMWYDLQKFKNCIDLVSKVLRILKEKKNIMHVFISSDLTSHGSDYLRASLNTTTLHEAYDYLQRKLPGKLNRYLPQKQLGILFNDSGFVALVQLKILSQASHLITLGAGTFQSWIVAVFKQHKKEQNLSWSLSRVCSTELKGWRNK